MVATQPTDKFEDLDPCAPVSAERFYALFRRYGISLEPAPGASAAAEGAELAPFEADRFRVLRQSHGVTLAPSTADWQNLAIRLAIRHREAGFITSVHPELRATEKSTRREQQIARDEYMAGHIVSENATMEEAATALTRYHRANPSSHGRLGVKLPAVASLRAQYSKRTSDRQKGGDDALASGLPNTLLAYLHAMKIIDNLRGVASTITRRIAGQNLDV